MAKKSKGGKKIKKEVAKKNENNGQEVVVKQIVEVKQDTNNSSDVNIQSKLSNNEKDSKTIKKRKRDSKGSTQQDAKNEVINNDKGENDIKSKKDDDKIEEGEDVKEVSNSDDEEDDMVVENVDEEQMDDKNDGEEEEEVRRNAKKQKTHHTQDPNTTIYVSNLNSAISDVQIEKLLKELKLPFKNIERTSPKAALIVLSSSSDKDSYLKIRTAKIGDTDLLFRTKCAIDKKKIVISNLANEITADLLKKYINEIGDIKDVILFPPFGRSLSTTAVVTFTSDVSDNALEYDGADIMGKSCHIQFFKEAHLEILITNLDPSITSEELKEYMGEAGKVAYVNLLRDASGNKIDSAIVGFEDVKGCREILDYDGADIQGKTVRIYWVSQQEKSINFSGNEAEKNLGESSGGRRGRGGRGGNRGGNRGRNRGNRGRGNRRGGF